MEGNKKETRIVIDINVLISALINPTSYIWFILDLKNFKFLVPEFFLLELKNIQTLLNGSLIKNPS